MTVGHKSRLHPEELFDEVHPELFDFAQDRPVEGLKAVQRRRI